eukprot:CAMPEP_0169266776 /NCGR_PEP_ID=MMETSP1016-20121227/46659_1 /TAXON_ID=342587 /ORGANISM="Karlodinium micrum, Strain CCMP2283" /LENGTH=66 /DNA_ID=CAMNT_0009350867 /DNA_START=354 /DNA_END=554 /DNA_ORIENTATION=+
MPTVKNRLEAISPSRISANSASKPPQALAIAAVLVELLAGSEGSVTSGSVSTSSHNRKSLAPRKAS